MAAARRPNQYTGVRPINPPNVIYADRAPLSTDVAYVRGDFWLDLTGLASYQYAGGGVWISLGTGSTGGINTVTGGSGGAISPLAGNVSLLGTANQITSTGSAGGHSITFSIPSAFTAPGSIASTTTIAAGTALSAATTVTAGTGITSTLGNIVAAAGNISATLGSVSAGTSVTAATTVTATLGAITASNGNMVMGTAGNGIRVKSGSNARVGVGAILSSGTLDIANTSVTANTVIMISVTTLGTVAAAQAMHVVKDPGVKFTVTSADATDTSTFDWYMVESF